MSKNWPIFLKSWFRGIIRNAGQFFENRQDRSCPCCDYKGKFVSAKKRGPREFRCPNCESRPRDRQIELMLRERNAGLFNKNILHIAPEWPLFRKLKKQPGYVGGDIIRRRNANAYVDITKIEYPDEHFDILICNHVLEHVPDDLLGMRECSRVLKSGGLGIFSVPIDQDSYDTWEPKEGMTVAEIEAICGWDHKRFYGLDFKDKLAEHDFDVEVVQYQKELQTKHRLFDEPIYFVTKK